MLCPFFTVHLLAIGELVGAGATPVSAKIRPTSVVEGTFEVSIGVL